MISALEKLNIKYHPQKLFYGPSWVVLGVNNTCNLHCKMCDVGTGFTGSTFYEHMMGAQPLNMPRELVFRIIDQVSEYYPDARLGFAFTEPGIYPHLMESLEYAHSKHLWTAVTTNGLLLPKQADEFRRVGLTELNISLDGPAAIHNEIRGNKKSFELAMEGIEKLFADGRNDIRVSVFCAITEWNIGHLVEFAGAFSKFPLYQIGFLHTVFNTPEVAEEHNRQFGAVYHSTPSNMQEINLDNYDLKKLWEEIEHFGSHPANIPIHWSPTLRSAEEVERFYRRPEQLMGTRCYDAFKNITIKSDGSVIPAHTRCYNVEAGNIYTHSLKEIWNSASLSKFRMDLSRAGGLFPACSRCCSGFAS